MGKHRDESEPGHQILNGVVLQQNFSPKGEIEGVVLDTETGPAQVNFPHGQASDATGVMPQGTTVRVAVRTHDPAHKHKGGDHPAYEFVELVDDDSVRDRRAKEVTPPRAEGTVIRLNFARHGEPNGVVLDTGDFVHLKPHGMKLVRLAIGSRVLAEGGFKPTVTGHRVIEATVVNGVTL